MINTAIPSKETITQWFESLQDHICQQLEKIDGKSRFKQDSWQRDGGGGGRSRVIENGNVFEKGGVNFSAVWGNLSPHVSNHLNLPTENQQFYATGVSIVLHPNSPLMPIIHMNVRYFEVDEHIWWFGGGIDLTPHYITPADATRFHQHLQAICQSHNPDYYPRFKTWADDYFYLKHRSETRGVGGIFFDRLTSNNPQDRAKLFAFVQDVGMGFVPSYAPFAPQYNHLPYTEAQKNWQMLRRGRYVEFNLIYDLGTKFGLDTNGRTESILMSLPPMAQWAYNYEPEPNSAEAQTLSYLKKGINWTAQPISAK